ncbi:MAG: S8 family serine peptidase [Cyanobacteria bacterium J06638_22]
MGFIPNDPLFADQWYLRNGQNGRRSFPSSEHINVALAWAQNITGQGVVIGVVDDGIDYRHPDLSPNYRTDLDIDLVDRDDNPLVRPGSRDGHGTSVAGIAAGAGGNGIGLTGVAPNAELTAIRLLAGWSSDRQEAQAILHQNQAIDIYNNSWGPPDEFGLVAMGSQLQAALQIGVRQGRDGRGSLYVWSAGNGAMQGDNVNYDGYANSRYVIAVGALTRSGAHARYSEPGAALLVSAYGDDAIASGIVATDVRQSGGYNANTRGVYGANYRDLNYTNDFGGTSAAAAMVSGTLALVLEANPHLSWRDAQHILVNTARRNDPSHAQWQQNGAGRWVNPYFGFGAVDASAAVALAQNWTLVAPERTARSRRVRVRQVVPDGQPGGLSSQVSVDANLTIERVEIIFDSSHANGRDLTITLTSPDGTASVLAEANRLPHFGRYDRWRFTSTHHWDEQAAGTWTLHVQDERRGNVGRLNHWQLRFYGTAFSEGAQQTDRQMGTAGNDTLATTNSNDRLTGLGGDDRLLGGSGNDRLHGGGGKDALWGNAGRDRLLGAAGRDALYGDPGRDRLLGGGGNDRLWGGGGIDRLRGGRGNDTFVLERGGGDRIQDFEVGSDRLQLGTNLRPQQLTWQQQGNDVLIAVGTKPLAWLENQNLSHLNPRQLLV